VERAHQPLARISLQTLVAFDRRYNKVVVQSVPFSL
jgi:hypothetical protein